MWERQGNQEKAGPPQRRGCTVVQLVQEAGSSDVPLVQRPQEQPSCRLKHLDDSSLGEGCLKLCLALGYTFMHQVKGCSLLCQQSNKDEGKKRTESITGMYLMSSIKHKQTSSCYHQRLSIPGSWCVINQSGTVFQRDIKYGWQIVHHCQVKPIPPHTRKPSSRLLLGGCHKGETQNLSSLSDQVLVVQL